MTRTYPAAERTDVVDDMHGHKVLDPYRWLEDADDARTQSGVNSSSPCWSMSASHGPLDTFAERAGTVSRPSHCPFTGEHVSFSPNGNPVNTRCSVRPRGRWLRASPDRSHGTRPHRQHHLDAWQPSKEGERLAYQVSEGGTEESVLYVMDVTTGEVIDGPIDRCRYSPVAWIPGGERFYYVRSLPPEVLPESERGFHRRVFLHAVGADAASDANVFGAGMTMTNYYGVEVSRWPPAPVSAEGTEPRNFGVADSTTRPPIVRLSARRRTSMHKRRSPSAVMTVFAHHLKVSGQARRRASMGSSVGGPRRRGSRQSLNLSSSGRADLDEDHCR